MPRPQWPRRLWTCSATLAALLLWWAASPVLFLVAAVADLFRDGSWPSVRGVAFIAWWLLAEGFGIVVLGAAALLPLPGRAARVYRAQSRWMMLMLGGFCWIFDVEITLEGLDRVPGGPAHILCRHATLIDTLLVGNLIANPLKLRMRYVFKKELRADPAIDIYGHAVPNLFLDRQSADLGAEVDAIRTLGQGCGPQEGVVLYPEGTLFTEKKRARVLQRMKEHNDPLHTAASALRHLLPPRLGGVLALLDTDTDIIFCAHAGFDGAPYVGDYLRGGATGRRVRVQLWRVAVADIPEGREARVEWLYKHWGVMDRWIAAAQ